VLRNDNADKRRRIKFSLPCTVYLVFGVINDTRSLQWCSFAIFANLGDSSSARATCCPGSGPLGDDRCCFVGSPRHISSSSSVPSVPFTMHDAYDYKPVLEKLPLHIEAIACYGKCSQ